jgi:hypothetical protein
MSFGARCLVELAIVVFALLLFLSVVVVVVGVLDSVMLAKEVVEAVELPKVVLVVDCCLSHR